MNNQVPNETVTEDPLPFSFRYEGDYGYVQARASAGMLYISGQFGHGPDGEVSDGADFPSQIKQSYTNARTVLAHYGLKPEDVVDELVIVRDLAINMRYVPEARKAFYGPTPIVASTIIETPRLGHGSMAVEIKMIALLQRPNQRISL